MVDINKHIPTSMLLNPSDPNMRRLQVDSVYAAGNIPLITCLPVPCINSLMKVLESKKSTIDSIDCITVAATDNMGHPSDVVRFIHLLYSIFLGSGKSGLKRVTLCHRRQIIDPKSVGQISAYGSLDTPAIINTSTIEAHDALRVVELDSILSLSTKPAALTETVLATDHWFGYLVSDRRNYTSDNKDGVSNNTNEQSTSSSPSSASSSPSSSSSSSATSSSTAAAAAASGDTTTTTTLVLYSAKSSWCRHILNRLKDMASNDKPKTLSIDHLCRYFGYSPTTERLGNVTHKLIVVLRSLFIPLHDTTSIAEPVSPLVDATQIPIALAEPILVGEPIQSKDKKAKDKKTKDNKKIKGGKKQRNQENKDREGVEEKTDKSVDVFIPTAPPRPGLKRIRIEFLSRDDVKGTEIQKVGVFDSYAYGFGSAQFVSNQQAEHPPIRSTILVLPLEDESSTVLVYGEFDALRCAQCTMRALAKCNRCKLVRYCSNSTCQRIHWVTHHRHRCALWASAISAATPPTRPLGESATTPLGGPSLL